MFQMASTASIFHWKSDAFVNSISLKTKMDTGLSLQFKDNFYHVGQELQIALDNKEIIMGKCHVHNTGFDFPKYIITMPTRKQNKTNSKLEYIEAGLLDLRKIITSLQLKTISIPALGCGTGNLKWEVVQPLIIKILQPVVKQCTVYLFTPYEPEIFDEDDF